MHATKTWFGPLLLSAGLLAACGHEPPPPAPAAPVAVPAPAPVALLSRQVLFGNPERNAGAISPDGHWLGYLAPTDGVMNVYVAPADQPDQAKVVTHDTKRGIRSFRFAYDGHHLLYPQDEGGDENFQMHLVDLDSAKDDIISPKGARAEFQALSAKLPDQILLSINDRNKQFFDVVKVDLKTGKSERIEKNDGYQGYVSDDDFKLRYASKPTKEGGFDWFVRDGANWKPWAKVPQEDALTTNPLGTTADGQTLYIVDSRERDKAGLFAIDTKSNEKKLVFEDAHADVGEVLVHPVTGVVQAVGANYLRNEWHAVDPEIQKDLDALKKIGDGEIEVTSRTLDDKTWVVLLVRSDTSAKYYLYDRASGNAKLWIDTRPKLADAPLVAMHPLELKSRDGLTLVSYLSLPKNSDPNGDGKPDKPQPMVLFVHGGPWARDVYGLSRYHQWLANRGYAVLSVNYRASTGFGKAFLNAGNLQWGRKMHDDLLDAVEWAVKNGITTADKVAIMGGSYGGYATLAGLTMTPKEFACGVDIVGPSNLMTLLKTIPPYWESGRRQFAVRMGDQDTEEGRALLKERSPLSYANQIERPLLIGQGQNDPRVNVAESQQIVDAMKAKNIPVTYVVYPDEGHGFARPPNNISFNAVAENFLGKCLGGRIEPIGADFEGASITVPEGSDLLPGLAQALKPAEAKPAGS
jgi:dipeptidyl aminopeptidase/acylaminoacyl peptidase